MESIQTEADFRRMLAAEHAIALICFDWSGQSKLSEQLVCKWEQDWLRQGPFRSVPLFRISPDKTQFLGEWVLENARNEEEGNEGGFGSVLWIQKGKIAGFVRYAAKTGFEKLSSFTEQVFKN
jgi:hypothetical protein